ncbi:MAG: hypothetical protein AAF591_12740 [Verrucomicrobiota bacterium]
MHETRVQVEVAGGGLPPFWDRSVAFFANLLALFFGNEEETTSLVEAVGEVDSYGGRLIPILNLVFRGPDNVLVLERHPDETLCGYFREDLGLSLPKLEILSHGEYVAAGTEVIGGGREEATAILAEVARHGASWVDGYVTDEGLERIAARMGKGTITTAAGSKNGNNKWLLFEALRERGLPIVATEMAASGSEVVGCLERLGERGFRSAVLKAQIGASGIGMVKLPETGPGARVPDLDEHLFYEGPAMVQGWLEPGVHGITKIHSPSVQMFLDDTRVHLFDMTEQILSHESVHEGNESPPPYLGGRDAVKAELLRQAGEAGSWLHEVGYRGTASADFLLAERGEGEDPEVSVCEINARVTGATYPSVLARHFRPEGAWLLRNLRMSEPLEGGRLLEMLDGPGHLYRVGRGMGGGVLPVNFNFGEDDLVHKGQFLCLGESPAECHELLRRAEEDLPMDWSYVRD